jgi:hypothetical protein
MVTRLYSAAKYPRRLAAPMDQSMILPNVSTASSIVAAAVMGGGAGGAGQP